MVKVVSTVPKKRFELYGVDFPSDWEVVFVDYPQPDDVMIKACEGADFLFVGSVETVSRNVIVNSPSLKMIHTEGVGFNKVDYEAAKEVNLPVCNNRAVNNSSVAEHTIGLMLSSLKRIALSNAQIRERDFAELQTELRTEGIHELSSQHVGLIGAGAIGQEVARMLAPFGCRVSYYDVYRPSTEREKELNISYMPLEDIFKQCDIISLHVPVLPDTVNLINRKTLGMMKDSAILINTSRGELVDQEALVEALEAGKIFCAVDTVTPEPVPKDHPLLTLSPKASLRFIFTPHVAGTTVEAFIRMLQWAVANMKGVIEGKPPRNVVNGVEKARGV